MNLPFGKGDASTEAISSRIPINRGGIPDDIAKVVLCLASEATDYMTGSLVLVDGGYMLNP